MSQTPSLPSERVSWLDDLRRPLTDFYLWCKTVDARIRETAASASTALADKANKNQTWEINFQVAKVTTDAITAILKSKRARVVTEVVTQSASGTCTLTGAIDGTPLGGSANSVSSSETEQAHASANAIAAGQNLVFTPSSVSACLNMGVSVRGTYVLDV